MNVYLEPNFKQNYTIMKKILCTLFVGFCFAGVAVAQEPAKAAKKKAAPSLTTAESKPATAEMIKAKEADYKAMEAKKTNPATASKAKAAVVADKQN